jgi:putative endonuclease
MDCFVYVLGSRATTKSGAKNKPGAKGKSGAKSKTGANIRSLTYVGWTNDVIRRLQQHNSGKGARTTRGRQWVLLHSEWFPTKREAMSREWHLKRDRAFRKKLAEEMKSHAARKPRAVRMA